MHRSRRISGPSNDRRVGSPPLSVLPAKHTTPCEIMRTMLKPVIAASALAIWARKDHRHAFPRSSDVHSIRSTLAADLHPECSSWCSSKRGRTASISAETIHLTSLAAVRQKHLG